jgi:hypothetical protein
MKIALKVLDRTHVRLFYLPYNYIKHVVLKCYGLFSPTPCYRYFAQAQSIACMSEASWLSMDQ